MPSWRSSAWSTSSPCDGWNPQCLHPERAGLATPPAVTDVTLAGTVTYAAPPTFIVTETALPANPSLAALAPGTTGIGEDDNEEDNDDDSDKTLPMDGDDDDNVSDGSGGMDEDDDNEDRCEACGVHSALSE